MPKKKIPDSPKRFSIRLTKQNAQAFQQIHETLTLDTRNATINQIVADRWEFERYRKTINLLKQLIEELKTL